MNLQMETHTRTRTQKILACIFENIMDSTHNGACGSYLMRALFVQKDISVSDCDCRCATAFPPAFFFLKKTVLMADNGRFLHLLLSCSFLGKLREGGDVTV